MRRDMDLLRDMLLLIEELQDVPTMVMKISSFLDLCDKPAVISMHLELLRDAGLIEARAIPVAGFIRGFEVIRITYAGYEYLDSVRNAKVWRNVKEKIDSVGGATLDIIKAVAVDELKKELNI